MVDDVRTPPDTVAADGVPIVTDPPEQMFASRGFTMDNGKVSEVRIETKPWSSRAEECFGPLWIRADTAAVELAAFADREVEAWRQRDYYMASNVKLADENKRLKTENEALEAAYSSATAAADTRKAVTDALWSLDHECGVRQTMPGTTAQERGAIGAVRRDIQHRIRALSAPIVPAIIPQGQAD
jgi:hypothetical protein